MYIFGPNQTGFHVSGGQLVLYLSDSPFSNLLTLNLIVTGVQAVAVAVYHHPLNGICHIFKNKQKK